MPLILTILPTFQTNVAHYIYTKVFYFYKQQNTVTALKSYCLSGTIVL